MKLKRTLAAMLAAVMVIGMVSCGDSSKDDDDDKDEKPKTTAAASEADEESEAEEESAAEEESEAETESSEAAEESTADAESEADDSVAEAGGYADGVYDGGFYTITVDESLWEYTEQVATDCAFSYIGEGSEMVSTANFNIVSMSNDLLAGLTPSDYADTIKEAYDGMEGYNVTDTKEGELNGYETYNLTVSYSFGDYTMEINQVILADDSNLVAISYGAIDEVMSEVQPAFEDVLSGFSFK